MLNLRIWSVRLIAFGLLTAACLAQNPEALKSFKLDFTVKEVEGGKTLTARTYSMAVSTEGPPSSIRSGNKVPYSNRTTTGGFNFIEVGVNIDCRFVKETQDQVSLSVTADVSSVVQETETGSYPVVRQNKWSSGVVVPIRKPTLIFSSDDVTTKRQIQLELTATPIK